jgi:hypothetical protein
MGMGKAFGQITKEEDLTPDDENRNACKLPEANQLPQISSNKKPAEAGFPRPSHILWQPSGPWSIILDPAALPALLSMGLDYCVTTLRHRAKRHHGV